MRTFVLATVFALATAFQAPVTIQRSSTVVSAQESRRGFLESAATGLPVAALVAFPQMSQAAKPPQVESMLPPRKGKSGQIKTSNAGSILKK
eukprot:CAMPEP_0197287312 /NCGR_PEP_ID=MMETSP0890-20130614/3568_1 /TAXON_ID=44058 ORGANISM="Aureoumbra lagunensis, Strain CCMP1510" /NCGR_SAMPLE_ID=MMETSP0890 /ASSEMBLY_ACC=CAM_ASM_000533 /LENGTH=91 /DNA_ID=CAMNT_0042756827 /DNA_START=83 /DNA_END=358 /DNA_ORIENTATION=-